MTTSKYLCSLLWNHICFKPNGRFAPCCRFDTKTIDHPVDKIEQSLSELRDLDFYRDLRSKVLSDVSLEGCQKCYREEKSGKTSQRQFANIDYPLREDELSASAKKLEYLEIFTGSECNLKCLSCNPEFSNLIFNEYKKLGWKVKEKDKHIPISFYDDLSEVKLLKFTGGESLLTNYHEEIIEKIPEENKKSVTLNYCTNVMVFPNDRVLEKWKKFKKIKIYFSIDAIDGAARYIRYPSHWDTIEKNIKRFFDLRDNNEIPFHFHISTTVSILNILEVYKIEQWIKMCNEQSKKEVSVSFAPIINPSFLSLKIVNNQLIEKYKERMDETSNHQMFLLKYLESQLNEDHKVKEEDFKAYINKLDKIRGVGIQNYLPELAAIYKL